MGNSARLCHKLLGLGLRCLPYLCPSGSGKEGFLLSGSMGFSVLLFKKESPTYPHITP